VVADFPQRDVAVHAMPELLRASAQENGYPFALVVRASGDPEALTPAIRAAVQDMDPALALGTVTTIVPAAIATLVPARRAMQVNPLDVIQAE